ncbi:MAG: hypothetical protein WDN29_16415 [Methylovirgula sp.]
MLKRILIALALFAGAAVPALAQQVAPACLPQTGIFSAVQEQGYIQAGFEAILTNGRGAAAPAIDCSGNVQEGQLWYNNNSPYSGFPGFGVYDSGGFAYLGYVDRSSHIFMGQIGGGVATIASDTTVDPCSVPQDAISITGVAEITSFGSSCQIGQFKFVSFTGSLIIEESSSLLTPGGGNLTTSAGDQAILEYTGAGVWRVAFYMPNNGVTASLSLQGGTLQFQVGGPAVVIVPAGTHDAAMLDVQDQQVTGGANITVYNNGIVSGNWAPDCGKGPLQTATNNGAFNFEPPAQDSNCDILLLNGSSAGSVNFAGWAEGSNVGDALSTTSGAKFLVVIVRIANVSHYLVSAYQ